MFCYSRNHFKQHEQVYGIITYKIFVTLNFFRKRKILLFFAVTDWGTMGQHVVKFFNHSDKLFKHSPELFKFLVKLMVFS